MRIVKSRSAGLLTALAVVAMVAAACGGSDDDPVADAASDDGVEEAAPGDDAGEGEADADVDADAETDAPGSAIQASDGWAEPGTSDLPAPGTMEIDLAGQTYTVEVACRGFGEVPDEAMDGSLQLNEFVPFNFEASAAGQDADGRNFHLTVSRAIFIQGDRANQIDNIGWGGDGQFDIVSFSNEEGVSRQQTPSSRDPEGSELPLVRLSPEGGFTAEGELRPEFEGEDEAPDGPYEVRGQCQDTWPEPVDG